MSDEIGPTLDILAKLISFDTTSRNSNLELIEWVEAFLGERGIGSARVANDDGSKANLYAVIGPDVDGGVVLSGHTDVVPVDGQAWRTDPFVMTHEGETLVGRGVADMKGFLALALAHVDQMRALKRPIVLAFSYDEEVGCLGAPALIETLAGRTKPSAVIVGEPTSMKVVSAHKGISVFTVDVEGREAHSSRTDLGISAIMEALKLVRVVEEMAAEAKAGAISSQFLPAGPSMTIGQIQGGTASNILARRCSFVWDLRCPTQAETDHYAARFLAAAEALDREMMTRAPETGVRVTRRSNTPPLTADFNSEAERLARSLTGDNGQTLASYAAEAGLFQRAGFPVVLCGPGSIDQAHQPNEWIARDQLVQGARFMQKLIKELER